MMNKIENLGDGFNLEKFLEARKKTKKVVDEVSSRVFLGMTEEDGHKLIDEILDKYGASNKWHPSKFRIGKNTTKAFREQSEQVKLRKDDIYFIDIGPVFDGHEGDYGETFVFGKSEEYLNIILACKKIFIQTAKACREEDLTGIELYEYASLFSKELGYELNLKMAGHRLGDFPHALHFKGKLKEVNVIPKEHLWVLEILIKHPHRDFGAFYEDLI